MTRRKQKERNISDVEMGLSGRNFPCEEDALAADCYQIFICLPRPTHTPSFLLCGFPCTLPALRWASLVSMRFHYRCSPVRPEDVGMWLPGINTSLQITPQKSLEKLWLWVPKHIKRQQKQEHKHFSGRRIFAAVCCFVSHKKSSWFNR